MYSSIVGYNAIYSSIVGYIAIYSSIVGYIAKRRHLSPLTEITERVIVYQMCTVAHINIISVRTPAQLAR